MTLSIIVPVYNQGKYLRRCLDSLSNHDTDEVEIIIVDDGSTDKSGEICDEYRDHHENYTVIHKENGGLSSARNVGLSLVQGDYIGFIDSDDFVDGSYIADMLKYIHVEKPDIIDFKCCFENKPGCFKISGTKINSKITKKEFITGLLRNRMESQICLRVYNRKLFENIRFPKNHNYEDMSILWKLIQMSEMILRIDYTYYIYNRTNENAITKQMDLKNMSDMRLAYDTMCDGLRSFVIENGIDIDYLRYFKTNGYVYIGYKLKNSGAEANDLKAELLQVVKSQRIKLLKYRDYNWKKYVVYRLLNCRLLLYCKAMLQRKTK